MEVNFGGEFNMEVNSGGEFQYGGEFRGRISKKNGGEFLLDGGEFFS
jgi:hypothetical protein